MFRTIIIAGFCCFAWPLASLAGPAEDCDRSAERVAAAVAGLELIGRLPSIGFGHAEANFKHPHGGTVEIICMPAPTVTIDTDSRYPSNEFLDYLSKVGAAETGLPASTIRRAAVRCRKQLADTGDDEIILKGASIRCSLYPGPPDLSYYEIARQPP